MNRPSSSLPFLVTLCIWVAGYGLVDTGGSASQRVVAGIVASLLDEREEATIAPATRRDAQHAFERPVARREPTRIAARRVRDLLPPIRGPSRV